jgi:hypothetical protein
MRYMMIVKASPSSEKGIMPTAEQFACMGAYNEELSKAGVLVDLSGLQSTAHGLRIKFDGGKKTVIDGPFAESKELIAGYWIINVKSPEEARAWALKAPNPAPDGEPGEIELRRFFEPEDFPSELVEGVKDLDYANKLKRP